MSLVSRGPQRIVCLTEETTERVYLLSQEAKIIGTSGYKVRFSKTPEEKFKFISFFNAKIDKILALKSYCVFLVFLTYRL
jgi:iron complex transport system substrate-binding protein